MSLNREQSHWLKLASTPHIGAKRFAMLIKYFGTAEAALTAETHEWQLAGIPSNVTQQRHIQTSAILDEVDHWLNQHPTHHFLTLQDDNYPALLKHIPDAPPFLFVHGQLDCLQHPQIALIGTRNPSREGLHNAALFSKELSNLGFVITSGFAIGIDGIAHETAIQQQHPTIAVLGSGLHHIYPQRHQSMIPSLLDHGGAILSEFFLNTPPHADNFPRRNRIIAGLTLGTLVIEAAKQSGSLITARLAHEYHREVFVLPGSIHNAKMKGCHHLIKTGQGQLIEQVEDIWLALKHWLPEHASITPSTTTFSPQSETSPTQTYQPKKSMQPSSPITLPPRENPLERELLTHLQHALSIDELVTLTTQSATEITQALLMLEIEGLIERLTGGRFRYVH